MTAQLSAIDNAVRAFERASLQEAGLGLLSVLGYRSAKTIALDGSPATFAREIDHDDKLSAKPACFDKWQEVQFLFQLTNDEIPMLAHNQTGFELQDPTVQRAGVEQGQQLQIPAVLPSLALAVHLLLGRAGDVLALAAAAVGETVKLRHVAPGCEAKHAPSPLRSSDTTRLGKWLGSSAHKPAPAISVDPAGAL